MKKILGSTWDSGTSQTLLPLSDFDPWAEDRKTSYISSIDQEPKQNSNWFSLSRGWTELELAELSNLVYSCSPSSCNHGWWWKFRGFVLLAV